MGIAVTNIRGEAETTMAAAPDRVFALVTDLDRLPEWNAIMRAVVERPERLVPDASWVVELSAMGQSWRSRSTLERLDPGARVFVYRSGTDDGNPSLARWTWAVHDHPSGSRVTVSWDLRPATLVRRLLLVRVRARQLRSEVVASLRAVDALLTEPATERP